MPQSDLIAAGFVGVAALLMLGLSELLRKLGASKEQSRKSAHLGSGFLACSFPWVFESPISVAILTGGFAVLVIGAKRFGQLQGVHGVERESYGAAVFPMVIAVLFWITDGDPILYGIPILVLTVSDSAAALIGKGYGIKHYKALGEQRSLEGSLAFFTVTFIAVQVPLLLMSEDTGRLECILIALIVAVLTTCAEAISVRGLDNLFIPLLVSLSLHNFMAYTRIEIVDRTVALLGFGLFCLMSRRLNFVTATGSIAGFLALYATYSLGGNAWVFPIIAVYLLLFVLTKRLTVFVPVEPLGLSRIFQTIIVEILLLFGWHYTQEPALYIAFLAALSGTTALIAARLGGRLGASRGVGPISAWLAGVLTATLAPGVGYYFIPDSAFELVALATVAGWFCMLLVFFFRKNTARFDCAICGQSTHEPRHCGEQATLSSGHRQWTTNRATMASIALASGLTLLVTWTGIS